MIIELENCLGKREGKRGFIFTSTIPTRLNTLSPPTKRTKKPQISRPEAFSFHIWCTRRRLNLEVNCQLLKGLVLCMFPRDTPGDTRRWLLGCFWPVSRCRKAPSKFFAPSPTNGNVITITTSLMVQSISGPITSLLTFRGTIATHLRRWCCRRVIVPPHRGVLAIPPRQHHPVSG